MSPQLRLPGAASESQPFKLPVQPYCAIAWKLPKVRSQLIVHPCWVTSSPGVSPVAALVSMRTQISPMRAPGM